MQPHVNSVKDFLQIKDDGTIVYENVVESRTKCNENSQYLQFVRNEIFFFYRETYFETILLIISKRMCAKHCGKNVIFFSYHKRRKPFFFVCGIEFQYDFRNGQLSVFNLISFARTVTSPYD